MQQWEAISPNGKGVVIQTSNHSTKVVLASPFHHQDETTQQAVSIHVPMTVPNSPAHCQPFQQQQQQDTFQISSSSSELLSQNTYLNTIAWSPKIMPSAKDMTQKENLSLLDPDKNGDIKQNYYIG